MSKLTIFTDIDAAQPVWYSSDIKEIRQQLSKQNISLSAGEPTVIFG